jgi:hypothetical protein
MKLPDRGKLFANQLFQQASGNGLSPLRGHTPLERQRLQFFRFDLDWTFPVLHAKSANRLIVELLGGCSPGSDHVQQYDRQEWITWLYKQAKGYELKTCPDKQLVEILLTFSPGLELCWVVNPDDMIQ